MADGAVAAWPTASWRRAAAAARSPRPPSGGLRRAAAAGAALLAMTAAGAQTDAALATATAAGLPAYGRDRPLPAPRITRRTLPNGLQLWVLPRQGLPRVDFVLAVQGAGYAADPPGQPGQASLLAGLMDEGTRQHDARSLAEAVQGLGGALGADASNDGIVVSGYALASQAQAMMGLLAEVVREPTFPDKEVQLARDNALQALKAAEATPGFRADGALAQAIYGAHPYGHTQPTEDAIAAATAAGLRAEHARRLRPDRALLVVAGRVTPAQALAWTRAAFGGWRAEGPAPAEAAAVAATAPPQRLLIDRPGSVQATIRLGRPGAAAASPDRIALRVASTVLGSGFSSRINLNLREEKGYTYGASAGARAYRLGGSIVGGADVRNEVTGAALREFIAEYRRIGSEPVPAAELGLAKRYLAGSYLLGTQQQAALAQTLAGNWLVGLPPDFLAEFVPRVQQVSAGQVLEVARKYFDPATQSIVVVGDKAAIAGQLSDYGDFVTPAR